MTIAAHIASSENGHSHLAESLLILASSHPDDHFIIFYNDESPDAFSSLSNSTTVQVSPPIKNSLSLYYWYNFKLPAMIRRYDATVFISESGALSLRAKVPQFLFLDNIVFLQPGRHPLKRMLQKYFSRFAEKALTIFSTEKFIATIIQNKYPVADQKTFTVYHGLEPQFVPLGWEQKQAINARFTDDNDFFLCHVSANTKAHVKTALKAFSIFKKWQKSSMQLVLLLDGVASDNLVDDFGNYKYRNEVKMIAADDMETVAAFTAAAYIFIYLPEQAIPENAGLRALQCAVPLITLAGEITRSMFGDAAVYCEKNETSVAEKMLLLYKDEALSKSVIAQGQQLLKQYDQSRAAVDLWSVIRLKSGL